MPQPEVSDSRFSNCLENSSRLERDLETVPSSAARAPAIDEAGTEIARELNGPLTALLLYMGEIKRHSHQLWDAGGNRAYLQQVIENALQQTEHVCAMIKQMADMHGGSAAAHGGKAASQCRSSRTRDNRAPDVKLSPDTGQKFLTRREREALGLISEGCSNKQGALRMGISPRTFESHRAVAMRKLGARNAADLVRRALLQRAI